MYDLIEALEFTAENLIRAYEFKANELCILIKAIGVKLDVEKRLATVVNSDGSSDERNRGTR